MKVTVVPAQVTTIEDKIMGNLALNQLLLFVAPVFLGGALYAFVPPFSTFNGYKIVAIAILALLCVVSAIRIKGMIVAHWVVVLLRYNLRPQFYTLTKNTALYREDYEQQETEPEKQIDTQTKTVRTMPKLDLHDLAHIRNAIDNPAANLRFETNKKGGLYVRLTEVED